MRLEDLNPLFDLRNRLTITLPYSKIDVTVYELLVKNIVAITNALQDLRLNQNNDIKDVGLQIIEKIHNPLIQYGTDLKDNISNVDLYEALYYIPTIIYFLSCGYISKSFNIKCEKCGTENKNVYIQYKPNDNIDIRSAKTLFLDKHISTIYNVKFDYEENFSILQKTIDTPRFKLNIVFDYVPFDTTIIKTQLPESLLALKELEIIENGNTLFKYERSKSRINLLQTLPLQLYELITEASSEFKYKQIRPYIDYACPNCGHRMMVNFEPLDHFLLLVLRQPDITQQLDSSSPLA